MIYTPITNGFVEIGQEMENNSVSKKSLPHRHIVHKETHIEERLRLRRRIYLLFRNQMNNGKSVNPGFYEAQR